MLQKQTTVIFGTGLIALAIAVSGCVFMFLRIKTANNRIAALAIENGMAAAKDEQYKILKKVLEETVKERERITSYIIGPDGVVDFIEFIERLGASTGATVKIDSIDPGLWQGKKNTVTEGITVNVTATGDWGSVYQFLSQIELLPYVTEMQQMQLERVDNEETKTYNWRTSIKFSALKLQ